MRIFNANLACCEVRQLAKRLVFLDLPPRDGRYIAGDMPSQGALRVNPPQCSFKRHAWQIGGSHSQPRKLTLGQALPHQYGPERWLFTCRFPDKVGAFLRYFDKAGKLCKSLFQIPGIERRDIQPV